MCRESLSIEVVLQPACTHRQMMGYSTLWTDIRSHNHTNITTHTHIFSKDTFTGSTEGNFLTTGTGGFDGPVPDACTSFGPVADVKGATTCD